MCMCVQLCAPMKENKYQNFVECRSGLHSELTGAKEEGNTVESDKPDDCVWLVVDKVDNRYLCANQT